MLKKIKKWLHDATKDTNAEQEQISLSQDIPEPEEPKVELKAIVHDPDKGIRVDLDWNPEFVEYLRENGYPGTTDEAVVQLWLTHLHKEIIDDLKKEKTNDFE